MPTSLNIVIDAHRDWSVYPYLVFLSTVSMGNVVVNDISSIELPFPLTATDRETLDTADEDFRRIDWGNLRAVIGK